MDVCASPGLTPLEDALENILSHINAIEDHETVPLMLAHGRTLAGDVCSGVNVPPADNSAMDGYALCLHSDATNLKYHKVGISMAGQPFEGSLTEGQCVRIMTGAIIPEGANAVEMQENTSVVDDRVALLGPVNTGSNIRKVGEDIKTGQIVVTKGTRLLPSHLSLIASVGVGSVEVVRRPLVGLIATGDELTAPGQPLKPGGIYESNRYALNALLEKAGADIVDFGVVKDEPAAIEHAFEQADEQCDLLISSGGVSVGDADYIKQVLDKVGKIDFWKVAIKPGKPFAFGHLPNSYFCGLPGNPVSSFVTFEQLVVPVLAKLSGGAVAQKPRFVAKAEVMIRKRPGRADFQRGIFHRDENQQLWVKPNGKQGSGIMSSVANANCYIVLAQQDGNTDAGEDVIIEPF